MFLLAAATAIAAPAQTFTTLHSFDGTDGNIPQGTLIQGLDGNFYGTTYEGGANGPDGTIYKITPQGALTVLHSFCTQTGCPGGANPFAGLLLGNDGNFYGTANGAGTYGGGTVFKISAQGTFTTLYNFCPQALCPDGQSPSGGLAQGTDGNFYSTTFYGGANGRGTVFKITPQGSLTTLYNFCPQTGCVDGQSPQAGLVQGTDGNLYGTTSYGGTNGHGTVFKVTLQGKLTTLHSFCSLANCTDGDTPYAGVIQGTDGNFYGTTLYGGTVAPSVYGTVFKITRQGVLTTLYSFCSQSNCGDGFMPYAGLFQGADGNFYGTTNTGGANFEGTVFKITPQGTLTTLFSFCVQSQCTDGVGSFAGVVEATSGTLYGTTPGGGVNDFGTVFSLSTGLGSFVETLPGSGKVGATIRIQGTNLTGTTAVAFNGTAATFTVVSGTQIRTTVPSGATTGTVRVTTPRGALKSNTAFRVTPQIRSFAPSSGSVGTPVIITGVSLTQTSKVTFGGVKATAVTVNSDTQVTATVPAGAVTGKIAITTPGGTASSATSFTVTP